jgi:hypothetical protein
MLACPSVRSPSRSNKSNCQPKEIIQLINFMIINFLINDGRIARMAKTTSEQKQLWPKEERKLLAK